MDPFDVDGVGDLLVLSFVAMGAMLAGLAMIERWLGKAEGPAGRASGEGRPGDGEGV